MCCSDQPSGTSSELVWIQRTPEIERAPHAREARDELPRLASRRSSQHRCWTSSRANRAPLPAAWPLESRITISDSDGPANPPAALTLSTSIIAPLPATRFRAAPRADRIVGIPILMVLALRRRHPWCRDRHGNRRHQSQRRPPAHARLAGLSLSSCLLDVLRSLIIPPENHSAPWRREFQRKRDVTSMCNMNYESNSQCALAAFGVQMEQSSDVL